MKDVTKVWLVEVTARRRVAYTIPELARQHLLLQDDDWGYAYPDEVTLTGPGENPARIWIVDALHPPEAYTSLALARRGLQRTRGDWHDNQPEEVELRSELLEHRVVHRIVFDEESARAYPSSQPKTYRDVVWRGQRDWDEQLPHERVYGTKIRVASVDLADARRRFEELLASRGVHYRLPW